MYSSEFESVPENSQFRLHKIKKNQVSSEQAAIFINAIPYAFDTNNKKAINISGNKRGVIAYFHTAAVIIMCVLQRTKDNFNERKSHHLRTLFIAFLHVTLLFSPSGSEDAFSFPIIFINELHFEVMDGINERIIEMLMKF